MVNIGEIISGIWGAFAPFIGKAVIAVVIVGVLVFAIVLISKRKK